MHLRAILGVCFILSFTSFFSQDLIVQKSGKKIYCEIVKQDSVRIYYISPFSPENQVIEISDVEQFYKASSAPAIEEEWLPEKLDVFELRPWYGGAFPIGSFASTAGALSGYTFGVDVIFRFNQNAGLVANFRKQVNYYNSSTLAKSIGANSYTTFSWWSMVGGGVGLSTIFPIDRREWFYLNFDLTAGIAEFDGPDILIRGQYRRGSYFAPVIAPFFNCGLSMLFRPLWNAALVGGIELVAADPQFKNGSATFLSINPRVGISIIFTKKKRT